MNDAEIRRLERDRDRMPCRATIEALDAARSRMGDGPWLPAAEDQHRLALTAFVTEVGGTWEWMGSWLRMLPPFRPIFMPAHADEIRADFNRVLSRVAGFSDGPSMIEGWTVAAPMVSIRRSPDADGIVTLSFGNQRTSLNVESLPPNEWTRFAVTPGEMTFELASSTRGQVWMDPDA